MDELEFLESIKSSETESLSVQNLIARGGDLGKPSSPTAKALARVKTNKLKSGINPQNPAYVGGPRSVQVIRSHPNPNLGQVNPNPNLAIDKNTRIMKSHDGLQAQLTDKSSSHLTSKHGHSFGIDDPLPANPNQKPTKHPQTRTRINK